MKPVAPEVSCSGGMNGLVDDTLAEESISNSPDLTAKQQQGTIRFFIWKTIYAIQSRRGLSTKFFYFRLGFYFIWNILR